MKTYAVKAKTGGFASDVCGCANAIQTDGQRTLLMVNGPYLKSAAKRRLPKRERIAFVRPRRTYCVWSVDFIRDALTYGRCFRTF